MSAGEQGPAAARVISRDHEAWCMSLSVIFSPIETCRRQGVAAFDYIRAAVKNLFAGKTAPRLVASRWLKGL
jgi:hypothetical protein